MRRLLTNTAAILLVYYLAILYFLYQPPSCQDDFFKPRKERQLSLEYGYVHDASRLCSLTGMGSDVNAGPDVVIMVLTMSRNVAERRAIRDTYGSVGRGHAWPEASRQEGDRTPDRQAGTARVVFLMGQTKDAEFKATEAELVAAESRQYGDVVQWEGLMEDYYNLTLKVLLGLRWVRDYCPHAHHVVKTDDDVFIHVPRLFRYIERNSLPPSSAQSSSPTPVPSTTSPDSSLHSQTTNGGNIVNNDGQTASFNLPADVIHGSWVGAGVVMRQGKYVTSRAVYPYRVYPQNVKGSLYLMPTSLAVRMLRIAEHLPYNNLEDVHVTGVLACATGARHRGFSLTQLDFCNTNPAPCDFADGARLAARDVTAEMFRQIWGTLTQSGACWTFVHRHFSTPDLVRYLKCPLLRR